MGHSSDVSSRHLFITSTLIVRYVALRCSYFLGFPQGSSEGDRFSVHSHASGMEESTRDAERNVPEAYKPQFMNLLAMMDFFIPIVYYAIVVDIQFL